MPTFGRRSKAQLDTCHGDLQRVLYEVIKVFDFTVLTGHRTKAVQEEAYATGRSTKQWPKSKHNTKPSIAVDIAPWPINWNDRERFTYLAGHIRMAGAAMGIEIRWGGDWDKDTEVRDNGFDDLVHFELLL